MGSVFTDIEFVSAGSCTGTRHSFRAMVVATETTADAFHRAGRDAMIVAEILKSASVHLGIAAWRAPWGRNGLLSRFDRYFATRLLRRQQRVACCHQPRLHDAVDSALTRTSKALDALDTVPVAASVRGDLTYAWLCLGQATFVLDLDCALPVNRLQIDVPDGADCAGAANRIRSSIGELKPLTISVARFSTNPKVAVPTGLAAMACRHLAFTLAELDPTVPPVPALDMASQPLGKPVFRNIGDAKRQVSRLCDRLQKLGDTTRRHADHIELSKTARNGASTPPTTWPWPTSV